MKVVSTISELPSRPAVYAMYGAQGRHRYVAYVGLADNLKRRLRQHFVLRNSSAVAGGSAVSLNPDLVTTVEWWEHEDFLSSTQLEAAEQIAFQVLKPVLRSRGHPKRLTETLLRDAEIEFKMRNLFTRQPTGRLERVTLQESWAQLEELEQRLTNCEDRLNTLSEVVLRLETRIQDCESDQMQ